MHYSHIKSHTSAAQCRQLKPTPARRAALYAQVRDVTSYHTCYRITRSCDCDVLLLVIEIEIEIESNRIQTDCIDFGTIKHEPSLWNVPLVDATGKGSLHTGQWHNQSTQINSINSIESIESTVCTLQGAFRHVCWGLTFTRMDVAISGGSSFGPAFEQHFDRLISRLAISKKMN